MGRASLQDYEEACVWDVFARRSCDLGAHVIASPSVDVDVAVVVARAYVVCRSFCRTSLNTHDKQVNRQSSSQNCKVSYQVFCGAAECCIKVALFKRRSTLERV